MIRARVDQVGKHPLVRTDPDARLHLINQEYGNGVLAGLFAPDLADNAPSRYHYPQWHAGVRDGLKIRKLKELAWST